MIWLLATVLTSSSTTLVLLICSSDNNLFTSLWANHAHSCLHTCCSPGYLHGLLLYLIQFSTQMPAHHRNLPDCVLWNSILFPMSCPPSISILYPFLFFFGRTYHYLTSSIDYFSYLLMVSSMRARICFVHCYILSIERLAVALSVCWANELLFSPLLTDLFKKKNAWKKSNIKKNGGKIDISYLLPS